MRWFCILLIIRNFRAYLDIRRPKSGQKGPPSEGEERVRFLYKSSLAKKVFGQALPDKSERTHCQTTKKLYLCRDLYTSRHRMNAYTISFKSIKQDEETFEFPLGSGFWKRQESDEILDGDVMAIVHVAHGAGGTFELELDFQGTVSVACHRCTAPLTVDVDSVSELVVKYGDEYLDNGDDLIIIPEREGTLDLSEIMYELVLFSLPFTCKHPIDECNPEMLKYLAGSEEAEEDADEWEEDEE